jgi:hypothetical protein
MSQTDRSGVNQPFQSELRTVEMGGRQAMTTTERRFGMYIGAGVLVVILIIVLLIILL